MRQAPIPINIQGIRNLPASPRRAPKVEDFDPLFEMISEGKDLKDACGELGLHAPTTRNRIEGNPDLVRRLMVANAVRAENFASRAIDTAEGVLDGSVDAAKARVAMPIFQWAAGQLDPHSWGKSRVEVTGKGGKDLEINNVVVFQLPDNKR